MSLDLNALKQAVWDKIIIIIIISEKHFEKFRAASAVVHLCIQEDGDHLKGIVHHKWNNVKTN